MSPLLWISAYSRTNVRQNYPIGSIAMQEIQDRRRNRIVPGGLPLHDYVNLYFCARNPMLYVRRCHHDKLCVLRVSPNVLDIEGVVVTDGNASSDYVRFVPAPGGLCIVDKAMTFARFWTHANMIEEYCHKTAKCAEVLVPHRLSPDLIMGVYVSCAISKKDLESTGIGIPVIINPDLFFI